MYKSKYFKEREFKKCVPSCRIEDMQENLLRSLDLAREIANYPFKLNSAYRTQEHELKAGREGTSSHCKGIAVDIQASNSFSRYRILFGLISAGFSRIGVYPSFIHADLDIDKPSCVWLSAKIGGDV